MNAVEQNYQKLNTYSEQIKYALDDYRKSYIYYNTNPDNQEYARIFSIDSGNVTTLNKDLFVTTNDIQKNIDDLNLKITSLNRNIKLNKTINGKLITELQQLEGRENGSQVLIDNSKESYKTQYIANWNMVVGIFITIGMLGTIFRKSHSSSNTV